ncbi:MAG: hypothetical protein Q8K72_15135, partial [Acidimicrobiales bacterium]|nr:hypothetical protein [Acidimicrobiales bacterium]
MNASALAASIRSFETPEAVYRERLALAARVAGASGPVVAALVVGSTALRRCSARADLDLVLVTGAATGPDRFSSQVIDGVRVEVERLGRRRALACTEGDGWLWELREAARLGCAEPVLDPTGVAAELAVRAASMTPRRARVEATLRDVYLSLVALGRGEGSPSHRADALRGCLDNLALLALLEHPRRYQKPKWVLADLLHAGEGALVDAILAAYEIDAGDATTAQAAVAGAGEIIAGAYEIAGLPAHEELLAMGHAPEFAEASYVSRCLDDAGDLEASGRFVEARYVAAFAARLAAGLLRGAGGVIATFAERGGDELARRYLA